MKKLVIGGGCFWGMEELFRFQPGVVDTEVGYAGGENKNPTYEHHPGHTEALQLTYNPTKTTINILLDYFFRIHNPTTLNRQGNDMGTSYRSVIFYTHKEQQKAATSAIIRNQPFWQDPIVTTVEPLSSFWPAEEYHQDYLQKNIGGYTCHYERKW